MRCRRALAGAIALCACAQRAAAFALRQPLVCTTGGSSGNSNSGCSSRRHMLQQAGKLGAGAAAAAGWWQAGAAAAVADGLPRFGNRVEELQAEAPATLQSIAGWVEPEVTSRALMRLSVDGKPGGTIIIGLYGKAAPETVANFEALVSGDTDGGYSYKGTTFYKVVQGLNMQAGAIGDISGKGANGLSAKGKPFGPENYDVRHGAEGMLSMVRGLDGQNDSRFFITIKPDAGWADGRYVAFGRVIEGLDALRAVDALPVQTPTNRPKKAVIIEECVLLPAPDAP